MQSPALFMGPSVVNVNYVYYMRVMVQPHQVKSECESDIVYWVLIISNWPATPSWSKNESEAKHRHFSIGFCTHLSEKQKQHRFHIRVCLRLAWLHHNMIFKWEERGAGYIPSLSSDSLESTKQCSSCSRITTTRVHDIRSRVLTAVIPPRSRENRSRFTSRTSVRQRPSPAHLGTLGVNMW